MSKIRPPSMDVHLHVLPKFILILFETTESLGFLKGSRKIHFHTSVNHHSSKS